MATHQIAMGNINECLRLKFEAGFFFKRIVWALRLSSGVISKYVTEASEEGMAWTVLVVLDEVALAAALLPATEVRHTRVEWMLADRSPQ